jgi:hypothetical protein
MTEKVQGKVVQIAVGPTGALYVLDDKGRVWQTSGGPAATTLQRYPLPEEIDPDKRAGY